MAAPAKIAAKQKRQESSFTEEELEVAEILLKLPHLFLYLKSRPFLFWGTKKKRSSFVASNDEKTHLKIDASSPSTPLSFSPSDTNSKSKQSRRRRRSLKKKTSKQLSEIVDALSSQKEQLKHEVSKVKDYHDKLRTMNLKLKARKLKLGLLRRRDGFDLNSCNSLDAFEEPTEQPNPVFEEKQTPIIYQPSELSTEDNKVPIIHQPFEPSAVATTAVVNFRYPYVERTLLLESVLHRTDNLLDMNFFTDEAGSRDKAAIAAQARKRRIEINRVKSYKALKQQRLK